MPLSNILGDDLVVNVRSGLSLMPHYLRYRKSRALVPEFDAIAEESQRAEDFDERRYLNQSRSQNHR